MTSCNVSTFKTILTALLKPKGYIRNLTYINHTIWYLILAYVHTPETITTIRLTTLYITPKSFLLPLSTSPYPHDIDIFMLKIFATFCWPFSFSNYAKPIGNLRNINALSTSGITRVCLKDQTMAWEERMTLQRKPNGSRPILRESAFGYDLRQSQQSTRGLFGWTNSRHLTGIQRMICTEWQLELCWNWSQGQEAAYSWDCNGFPAATPSLLGQQQVKQLP